MSINNFRYSLPANIRADVESALRDWTDNGKVARVWTRDASVWTDSGESQWLGWLDIADAELGNADEYREFYEDVINGKFSNILLMGMGGSSLCPEVLSLTFGKTNFHILDSTVPAQIASVESKLDLASTLFIVASKSGTTLEPNCFQQYFFERVAAAAGKENAGKQFVAITDPGSKMETIAKDAGFRHIFYGKPDIGGRFSALSAFGMTAAAAMGINVAEFLTLASEMTASCRQNNAAENPGAELGCILGTCQVAGIDKLTIFAAPEVYDLGAWLEQLTAESTGKNGVAIIPVDREPSQSEYSKDRVFAFLSVGSDDAMDAEYDRVSAAGHPAVRIELGSTTAIGQEFFRWEFAIAVAGSIMKINPFDQPDVESAKVEARKLTSQYEETGSLPDEEPFFNDSEIKLFTSSDYADTLTSQVTDRSAASLLTAHLDQIRPDDYFALLGYIEMNAEHESLLQELREKVLHRYKVATCLGFGPRFLHSTGQAYKGGGNNGVFLQITSDDIADIAVPGQKFTFGIVKAAQARGDFQVLIDRGRRALRIHLGSDPTAGLRDLLKQIGI